MATPMATPSPFPYSLLTNNLDTPPPRGGAHAPPPEPGQTFVSADQENSGNAAVSYNMMPLCPSCRAACSWNPATVRGGGKVHRREWRPLTCGPSWAPGGQPALTASRDESSSPAEPLGLTRPGRARCCPQGYSETLSCGHYGRVHWQDSPSCCASPSVPSQATLTQPPPEAPRQALPVSLLSHGGISRACPRLPGDPSLVC